MTSESYEACRKWCTIMGACLAVSTSGFCWFWGNLSIYATSYIRHRLHQTSGLMAPWVQPLWLSGTCGGNFLAGQLARWIGKRWALLFGMVLQTSGVLLVYMVIDKSMFLFNLCVGLLYGIGSGCVVTTVTHVVIDWVEDKPGLFIGIVRCSMVLGAILTNHFVTSYLNPDNKTPDTDVGSLRFFSQEDVIEKVPDLFLFLGGIFSVLQLFAFVLVRERSLKEDDIDSSSTTRYSVSGTTCQHGQVNGGDIKMNSYKPRQPGTADGDVMSHKHTQSNETATDLTPGQMLRTVEFYTLFFTMALASVSFIAVSNYYKTYGQLWIRDDFFLTIVGDVLLVIVVVTFLVWGALLDRYSVKTCLMVFFGCLPIVSVSFYFSPMLNKWVFCLTTFLFGAVGSPMYVIYTTCAAKLFGKTYFSSNFGLITMSLVLMNLITPPLLGMILTNLGWFYIFALAASLSLIALVVVMTTLKPFY